MDTNIAYCLSFLAFVILAYRLCFKKAKDEVDKRIESIRDTLHENTKDKDDTLIRLNALKYRYSDLEKEIQEREKETQKRMDKIRLQHAQDLEKQIQERISHNQEIILREQQHLFNALKQQLIADVIKEISKTSQETIEFKKNFDEKSLNMLKEHVKQ